MKKIFQSGCLLSSIVLIIFIGLQPIHVFAVGTEDSIVTEGVIPNELKFESKNELTQENQKRVASLLEMNSENNSENLQLRSTSTSHLEVTSADNTHIAFTYNGNEFEYIIDGTDLLLQVGEEYLYALQNEIVEVNNVNHEAIEHLQEVSGIARPSWKFIGQYETTNKKFLDAFTALGFVIGVAAEIFGFGGFLFGKVTLGIDFLLFLVGVNTTEYWGTAYQFKDVLCSTFIRETISWFSAPPNVSNRPFVKFTETMYHTVNPDNTGNSDCYGLV